jgi:hypothetical protein
MATCFLKLCVVCESHRNLAINRIKDTVVLALRGRRRMVLLQLIANGLERWLIEVENNGLAS